MGIAATSPATLDDIEFDAVITKSEELSADVPQYAVEKGYSVGDTIIIKPVTLSISATIANRPVTWANRHAPSPNRIAEVTRRLRTLFVQRKLVTYTANGDTWKNMAITSLSIPDTKESGDTVTVTFSLSQVAVTEKKTTLVTVAFPRGGTTKSNVGSVSSKSSGSTSASSASSDSKSDSKDDSKGESILHGVKSFFGGLFG